ncbi:GrpB family protein [Pelagibius litoralis]|uniref:GrpB family protein n=1 Tax=Pelagibius litoralis TaxID=374515 RepID=A0A967KCX0_9PROT|nr:GrpB family protein [Pelagibius litoralis]NIA71099.1 GrpB family protein [Pelagibius litoralis]
MFIDEVSTAVRSGPIAVVPYDQLWPAVFEQLQEAIRHTLGETALEVHHIGSTAVPGLCAKPKIDIDVVLRSADDIVRSVDLLKETDREYHGDPYNDGMWTFTSRRGLSPGHRIYLCAPGTPVHLKRILFRDYLRANPEAAAAYGALKRKLVIDSKGVWRAYTEGKTAFVADVVERALSPEPE